MLLTSCLTPALTRRVAAIRSPLKTKLPTTATTWTLSPLKIYTLTLHLWFVNFDFIIIIIIRFRQCQGNYRSSVAYRDNYPFCCYAYNSSTNTQNAVDRMHKHHRVRYISRRKQVVGTYS